MIRWGFLGAGFIASRALAPAVHAAERCTLQAVAARDADRAARLEPVRALSDYSALLDDAAVDAVYISLTNEAHLPWVTAALAAGKHVLCEKPLGLNAAEVAEMFAHADAADRLLVEASMYRWHPRTRRAAELVQAGAVGPIETVSSSFTFTGVPEGNYRLDPDRGGGAWYDVGCYTVSAARWALNSELGVPDSVDRSRLPSGVDGRTDALWSKPRVRLRASINDPADQELRIQGRDGLLDVGHEGEPFTAWRQPTALRLQTGSRSTVESFPAVDPYEEMVTHFNQRLHGSDAWVVPPEESLAVARTMDAVRSWGG